MTPQEFLTFARELRDMGASRVKADWTADAFYAEAEFGQASAGRVLMPLRPAQGPTKAAPETPKDGETWTVHPVPKSSRERAEEQERDRRNAEMGR